MAVYIGLAYAIQYLRGTKVKDHHKVGIERVFNGVTFASSLVLLAGVVDQQLLQLIGSIKPYLLFAAAIGIVYSLVALANS